MSELSSGKVKIPKEKDFLGVESFPIKKKKKRVRKNIDFIIHQSELMDTRFIETIYLSKDKSYSTRRNY